MDSSATPATRVGSQALERWLEIDLSWFQGESQEVLVTTLFDRVEPLWSGSGEGRCGLVLCVGWLLDAALAWDGDPDRAIPCCNGPAYEAWTYARLAGLLARMRGEATGRGLGGLRLGLLLSGYADLSHAAAYDPALRKGRTDRDDDQYGYNVRGGWFARHPEVRDPRFDLHFCLSRSVDLPAGERLADGSAPSLGALLAARLAAMTQAVGFDAVVLRDCFLTSNCSQYRGEVTMPPALRQEWTGAIIAFLAELKCLRPDLLTLGYSGYTGQLTAWRATGFDLEAVARAGCLDCWITQTWASAFQDYWRADHLGYQPALVNCLVDQAMLAGTPARHFFLVETFDAWEPFESLRDYPGKIDWLIQALGRAGVAMPDGSFARSAGCYISWLNKRNRLLPAEQVDLLRESLGALEAGRALDPRPTGPCLVHDRRSMLALLDHPVPHCRGENYDLWLSVVARFGVGMLSATRAEWLGRVQPDGAIYPCPADPPAGTVEALLEMLGRGRPVLILGQADCAAPAVRQRLGLICEPVPVLSKLATACAVAEGAQERLGCAHALLGQHRRSLASSPDWEALLSGLGGPVYARHARLPCWIWETPRWASGGIAEMSCCNLFGLQAFWLVAETAGEGWARPRWRNDHLARPCSVLAWRLSDRRVQVLLGNLENGMAGESMHAVSGKLEGAGWTAVRASRQVRLTPEEGSTRVLLAGHQRAILESAG